MDLINKRKGNVISIQAEKVNGAGNRTANEMTTYFSLEGMTCPACAKKIERTLSEQAGVKNVQVDFLGRGCPGHLQPRKSVSKMT